MFPASNWFLGGPARPRVVAPINLRTLVTNPFSANPPEIAPDVRLPENVTTVIPSAIAAGNPNRDKSSSSTAVVSGNIAESKRVAAAVNRAVANVPTFQEQKRAVAAAITTTPTQRANVARIVYDAANTLEKYQPAMTTEDGIVVTSKSPTPTTGTGAALLSEENPIVPKLLAETAPALGPGPGGASNEAGPNDVVILAIAAIVVIFVIGV